MESFRDKGSKDVREKSFITEEFIDKSHARWGRTGITIAMTTLVFVMNLIVVGMVFYIAMAEHSAVLSGAMTAESKSVNSSVFLALIAGTVAEVSALLIIIIKSLFNSKS